MESKTRNPTAMFPSKDYEKQTQEEPGLQQKMNPIPDCGEEIYKGSCRLKGRKVLITGGDSGIGRATAIAMFREGADVCISYLPSEQKDADSLKCLFEKNMKDSTFGKCGTKCEFIPGDLKEEKFSKQLIDQCVNKLGGLDTLILVAGKQVSQDCITDISTEQLLDTFKINVFSLFHTVKAALPHLKEGSRIITTSSIEAFKPSPFLMDYSCTKAAIVSFTHSLAKQLAPKGILVNSVAPGPIWTPLLVSNGYPKDKLPEFGKNTPIGRAGQPAELAGMYVYLASNDSTFCTGDVYPVTGGKHI